MSLDPSIIPLQDSRDFILDVSRSPLGANLAWNFIKQNWKTIQAQYNLHDSRMTNVLNIFLRQVAGAGGHLKTLNDYNDVKALMERNNIEFLKSAFIEALESIEANIFWVSKNAMELKSFLDSYKWV
ncbi:Endoplasmic reticulum aminopeptidase 2 [Thelohanellus kitauei]|uniref:Endoplasmic reticulum aminopeptidase 2 n=1 Tax=Thelohanellus kitauei TaxID=669202 RepID=A0A0C2MNR7_THEKT|nr:Endoplasmic reticulum aminopeptidase 2 [Thelohanellus kitauei]KII68431.1 Endoplasmic reticulum aminopeptidase 2 [Thelohanellus kitauei]